VHSVSQSESEALGWAASLLGEAEGLLDAVSLKRHKLYVEEELRMPDGSEFHTAGAATLKPWEAKGTLPLDSAGGSAPDFPAADFASRAGRDLCKPAVKIAASRQPAAKTNAAKLRF